MKLFKNRKEAGYLLAKALESYREQDLIVLGLPRGGVLVASEIASFLKAPLDLAFARKIGHPLQEEYAIAAVSENGYLVGNSRELEITDKKWLEEEKEKAIAEIKRRRSTYLPQRPQPVLTDKIVIIADDGIATGLTLQAAIQDIKSQQPKKVIVAVPVSPKSTAELIADQVDEFVCFQTDPDYLFLGGISAYYEDFHQVSDREILDILLS
ncbi:MAG: phosphoribosyl transferase [Chlamydiae bacterium CG10_big_fil_rev_8_21_14_0_10_35_9]|nr:MAG: phosphoribosyl transferase [Chlamydiae bacterium CG10_big_fil_rev_8_21_14_0_10_35_9]